MIIQIPCYNEERSLPTTLQELPRIVPGFDEVEWLIVDDGSTDNTAAIARENGVDHIVTNIQNKGLARTFMIGLAASIEYGADVIVNTDADNQYKASDIPKLVEPVVKKQADFVVGERPISDIEHFSLTKKILQKFGSWVVRKISKTNIADAPSGFRAFSRDAAEKLVVFNNYTYTLETLIQAGQKNMAVRSVPVGVNADLRPSRLVKSIPSYVIKSLLTIVRIFIIYRPFLFFSVIGSFFFSLGILIGMRFMWFYFTGEGAGHIQSLILAGVLLGIGGQTILVAFIADLQAANRRLLEEIRYRQQKMKA